MRIFNKKKPKQVVKKAREFSPYERKNGEKMSNIEKMDQGFNGSTYTVNGIDIDFS